MKSDTGSETVFDQFCNILAASRDVRVGGCRGRNSFVFSWETITPARVRKSDCVYLPASRNEADYVYPSYLVENSMHLVLINFPKPTLPPLPLEIIPLHFIQCRHMKIWFYTWKGRCWWFALYKDSCRISSSNKRLWWVKKWHLAFRN